MTATLVAEFDARDGARGQSAESVVACVRSLEAAGPQLVHLAAKLLTFEMEVLIVLWYGRRLHEAPAGDRMKLLQRLRNSRRLSLRFLLRYYETLVALAYHAEVHD